MCYFSFFNIVTYMLYFLNHLWAFFSFVFYMVKNPLCTVYDLLMNCLPHIGIQSGLQLTMKPGTYLWFSCLSWFVDLYGRTMIYYPESITIWLTVIWIIVFGNWIWTRNCSVTAFTAWHNNLHVHLMGSEVHLFLFFR